MSVAGCITEDTRRDISALLNDLSAAHGVDPVEVLGGAVIAEAGWNEHAERVRTFPDVSFGIGQPSVAWCVKPDGLIPSTDPRYRNANTPTNRAKCRDYFFDAERALAYCTPLYAKIRATTTNGLDAWCKWNKPAIPPEQNPNRAHYARSLTEAELYRVEEPMPDDTYVIGPGIKDAMQRYADEPRGDEKPLSEDYQAAPGRDRLYLYSKQANEVYVAPKA